MCPHCGSNIPVTRSSSGQVLDCPACAGAVSIPAGPRLIFPGPAANPVGPQRIVRQLTLPSAAPRGPWCGLTFVTVCLVPLILQLTASCAGAAGTARPYEGILPFDLLYFFADALLDVLGLAMFAIMLGMVMLIAFPFGLLAWTRQEPAVLPCLVMGTCALFGSVVVAVL